MSGLTLPQVYMEQQKIYASNKAATKFTNKVTAYFAQ